MIVVHARRALSVVNLSGIGTSISARASPWWATTPAARQAIQDLDNPRKVAVQQGILRDTCQPGRHLVTVVTDRTAVTGRGIL